MVACRGGHGLDRGFNAGGHGLDRVGPGASHPVQGRRIRCCECLGQTAHWVEDGRGPKLSTWQSFPVGINAPCHMHMRMHSHLHAWPVVSFSALRTRHLEHNDLTVSFLP